MFCCSWFLVILVMRGILVNIVMIVVIVIIGILVVLMLLLSFVF